MVDVEEEVEVEELEREVVLLSAEVDKEVALVLLTVDDSEDKNDEAEELLIGVSDVLLALDTEVETELVLLAVEVDEDTSLVLLTVDDCEEDSLEDPEELLADVLVVELAL